MQFVSQLLLFVVSSLSVDQGMRKELEEEEGGREGGRERGIFLYPAAAGGGIPMTFVGKCGRRGERETEGGKRRDLI